MVLKPLIDSCPPPKIETAILLSKSSVRVPMYVLSTVNVDPGYKGLPAKVIIPPPILNTKFGGLLAVIEPVSIRSPLIESVCPAVLSQSILVPGKKCKPAICPVKNDIEEFPVWSTNILELVLAGAVSIL